MDIKHRIKAEISEFMDLYWVCRMRYEASWPDAIYSIHVEIASLVRHQVCNKKFIIIVWLPGQRV